MKFNTFKAEHNTVQWKQINSKQQQAAGMQLEIIELR